MKNLLVIFVLLLSSSSFANLQADMQTVMHSYLYSIKTGNKPKLKAVVSKKYFETLNKDGQLDKLFKRQKKDGKKISFDLKFQKYHNKKNQFLVNIKDKSEKKYSHYWYIVEFKDGKYKILKEQYLD